MRSLHTIVIALSAASTLADPSAEPPSSLTDDSSKSTLEKLIDTISFKSLPPQFPSLSDTYEHDYADAEAANAELKKRADAGKLERRQNASLPEILSTSLSSPAIPPPSTSSSSTTPRTSSPPPPPPTTRTPPPPPPPRTTFRTSPVGNPTSNNPPPSGNSGGGNPGGSTPPPPQTSIPISTPPSVPPSSSPTTFMTSPVGEPSVGDTTESAASAAPTSETPGEVITTTNAAGHTIITTYYPPGNVVRSTKVRTKTLPNGTPIVQTQTILVGPTPNVSGGLPGGGQGATPTTGKPSLQTGAASATRGILGPMLAVIGGAVGFAWLL